MPLSEETKHSIIKKVNTVLLKYCPPLVNNKISSSGCEVIGNTPASYGSNKKLVPGMYFSSTAIRKDSIVFYFFPCYMNEEKFKPLAPNLWKKLKGKTCFHFNKIEDIDEKEMDTIFKLGIDFYKKQGWII